MGSESQDAEDATQEILVKVATRLSTFNGDARVTTWAHRVAVNHLLTTRRGRAEDPAITFIAFGDDLSRDLDTAYDAHGVDEHLLAEEVMVGCTQAMLLFARRVEALKLDMQRFTNAGAIFRSHRELPTPPQLVDAVLRAVA